MRIGLGSGRYGTIVPLTFTVPEAAVLHHLTVDSHRLAVWSCGTHRPGEPTVLIHGITHSIFFWAPDRTFAPYGPCFCLSLPDHYPAIGVPAERPLRPERYADLLAGAVRTLTGGSPATLVGVSTGGFAALAIAARAPQLARRVVCISGFAQGRWIELFGFLQRLARGGPAGHALFRAFFQTYLRTPELGQRLILHSWANITPRRSLRAYADYPFFWEVHAAMLPALYQLDHDAMLAAFGAFPAVDITAWLPRVAAPTLVVGGEGDRVVPPEQARYLAARLPRAELLSVPGAGHLPHWEDYPRFRAALDAWMGRNAAV